MYTKLKESTDTVLGYHVSGKVTRSEVEEIQHEINQAIQDHGKIRFLGAVGDLDMPEPGAVWQDLKMLPDYIKHIERVAVVGEAKWQKWATKLSDSVLPMEARHFTQAQLLDAWRWLKDEE